MRSGARSRITAYAACAACGLVFAALAGCKAVGGLAGAATGAATSGVSGNPAAGVAVGIGVKAAVDASIDALLRRWMHEEQEEVAAAAGRLAVGQTGAWRVRHAVPYQNREGRVRVVRAFTTPIATCKEALFTVDEEPAADEQSSAGGWYAVTVCGRGSRWNWASAEPAVDRWGALQ
ncbi:conserved exported hypothetical protein [Burkholderiales bacterium 8X]|nr:conserved exported hypothetical protein [Burkholderiales bacterium 8X]